MVSHELRTPLTSITGALDLVLGGLAGELEPRSRRATSGWRGSRPRSSTAIVDDLLDLARLAKGKLRDGAGGGVPRRARPRDGRALPARGGGARPGARGRDAAGAGRGSSPTPRRARAGALEPAHERDQVRAGERRHPACGVFRSPALPGVARALGLERGRGDPRGRPRADLREVRAGAQRADAARARHRASGSPSRRGIVEAHGGAIWAESAPGDGVRFVVVLPEEPPAGPVGAAAARDRTRRSSLVVDEPDAAALALRRAARARGMRCARASDRTRRSRGRPPPPPAPRGLGPAPRRARGRARSRTSCATTPTRAAPRSSPSRRPSRREAAFRGGADAFLREARRSRPRSPPRPRRSLRARPRPPARASSSWTTTRPSARSAREVLREPGLRGRRGGRPAPRRAASSLEQRPQVLLVDVQLPDGDGFSLLEALAERARGRAVRGGVPLRARRDRRQGPRRCGSAPTTTSRSRSTRRSSSRASTRCCAAARRRSTPRR